MANERGLLIASDDVELRRLGTRQQQILQRAAEIRREMEAGWQVLEREHEDTSVVIDWSRYQLDQAAFERAEHIDACAVISRAEPLATEFSAAGVAFSVPLRQMPYGVEFYVRDPDGYVVVLASPDGTAV